MGFIKKPGQIAPKQTIAMLVYGQPGIGKTTLGCSAPEPVLFDFDGGVNRINGAHQVPTFQPSCYEDLQPALAEIEKDYPECRTVVVDTVGKLLDSMMAYIIKNDSKMVMRDGTPQLKAYGLRKTMFQNFIKSCLSSGRNVIFIAHDKEERNGDTRYIRPEISGSSTADLMKELDLVGYMQAVGDKRVITFGINEQFYTKNCCNLPATVSLPVLVNGDGQAVGQNDFVCRVIEQYTATQIATAEETARYTALMDDINGMIAVAKDVDGLNATLADLGKVKHIYNSKLLAGSRLNARAAQLGCKYSKADKRYVNA